MAPQNIGIKAIEIYFPSRYVAQSDLEQFLGTSPGKYTVGLGQTNMSFCDDREDTNSLALTAVSALLTKNKINLSTIGRLEVGTETLLDKAKSTKTVLMSLFMPYTDIEGVDTYNACYGGTAALLNAVHWIESSGWDGRDAIVVAADIAMYDTLAARPTGGAGCVAMLIGADAPLVFESTRASFMRHEYDFYKPNFGAEYPIVDGRVSASCYLEALGGCYRAYLGKKREGKGKVTVNGGLGGPAEGLAPVTTPLDEFDFFVFHAPYCKLVSKAYAQLLYDDLVTHPENPIIGPGVVPSTVNKFSLQDKSLEKHFIGLSRERFLQRVQPSLTCPTMCGNMYTASVYSGLVSLLSNVPNDELLGKQIGVFSFGGGLASTLFSLRVTGDVQSLVQNLDLDTRLAQRERVSAEFYDEMCQLREKAYQQRDYTPVGDVDALAPGTYYLVHVDEMYRRTYAVKE
ncbi:Hydroxymethylglutaryl-CoA synthase [Penicillium cf. griseofulvum]|uniref:Hydroxymethylglutaryl-CoA synthase n=1 Tax=Penicillium cf. griseofulvum TaxID=2972120 RepID=A0A9W9T668_9EURO|nr:Hydroxymethylglutaryl-CoA synthase [Penicillium cf. griseofulvum]KAJ5422349.1 Hydroxymethylglutaryl-CoA synthase [Penicillium cf. griseofulvum]KAJ5428532.1 Hydroxymethylglutaryl-CoA synthase [Penicillium cf. griseofulvum]